MRAETPTQAVIYYRVSTTAQIKKGDGLGSQETRCREYAGHKDYKVVQVFRDEGVSGGMIDRPGMQAMLSFLKKHRRAREHAVIIDDISRLARGLEAHIQLRTAISEAGGRLESPSIEFGEDSDSQLIENLLASVSQHQRQKNAEQVTNRMRARMLNGYWVLSRPTGYRYERVTGHGKILVRAEPMASLIAKAFESLASGRFESPTEVKRFFGASPGFPKDDKGRVHLQRVIDILRRVIYAGYIEAQNWNIALRPGKHPPLISFETWQKVQDRLNGKARVPFRKNLGEDFPLRGFIRCDSCGHPMTSCWSKGRGMLYPYYFCDQKSCPDHRKSIRREKLEEEFVALLRSAQPSPSIFYVALNAMRELWEDRSANLQERQAAMKSELVLLERKSGQLMERIISAESPALISVYEGQIVKLEE
jgi:DNA invertase Pin-like site-specific DNA recombinase